VKLSKYGDDTMMWTAHDDAIEETRNRAQQKCEVEKQYHRDVIESFMA